MDPTCNPLIKADLNIAAIKYSMCQQQRSMLSPQYGTVPLEYKLATWWQAAHIGPILKDPMVLFH